VKLFFRKRVPHLTRIVLVESGPRELFEQLLPFLYRQCPEIDLVTCYAGAPTTFRAEAGLMYQIFNYQGADGRARLVEELKSRNHAAIGILCAAEPIMTKWKWLLAVRLPLKLLIVNENCDMFWVDYSNWRTIKHFILFRAGLSGAGAVTTIGRLVIFPFTVLFLLVYAAIVHARRLARSL
jgi:hypothetical protein